MGKVADTVAATIEAIHDYEGNRFVRRRSQAEVGGGGFAGRHGADCELWKGDDSDVVEKNEQIDIVQCDHRFLM
jgi:hypothetical protein